MSTQHLCAADSDSSRIQFEGKWTTLDVAELGIVGATCSQVMAPVEGSNNTGVDVHFNGSTISVFGAYVLSPDGDIPLFFTALDNSSVSAPIPLDNSLNGTVSSIYSSPSLSLDAHELGFLVTLLPDTAFYLDTVTITMGADERLRGGGSGSNVPIGPIVGGIVGGIVVIVCSILAFYYLYWQKRHTGRPTDGTSRDLELEKSEQAPLIVSQSTIVPFTLPNPVTNAQHEVVGAQMSDNGNEESLYRQPSDMTSQKTPSRSTTASSSNFRVMNPGTEHRTTEAMTTVEGSGGKFAEAYRARSMQAVVLHHKDSGMRFNPNDQSSGAGPSTQLVEDVPPMYTES